MSRHGLNRRQALRKLAMGGIGVASAPLWVQKLNDLALAHASKHAHQAAPAAEEAWKPKFLNPHQNETVIVLSELIIPQTDTPGARAAKVNEFIDTVLDDAETTEQKNFVRGLQWIDARSNELFGAEFTKATLEQQTALLTILSSRKNKSLSDQIGVEFFGVIKSMTITGYYTSEVGMKEELGDDGNLFFDDYPGCTHPEHKV
ncbi:MAG TPA: gluconate 2-dehydrogenase subunit 3 family protein [Acidobacteriota bacterium]|nr:gluconate 2-dehydrogenase subunit 3 family protein [Acidobacteriota bacterium]